MDKRRYVTKKPRVRKSPTGMDADTTGNAAQDGFTLRHREPLQTREHFGRNSRFVEDYDADSMMDEFESRFSEIYGDE